MSITNSGASSTNLDKLTREEILADEIQRALRKTSVVWSLARDLSSRLRPGQRYTTIPRSVGRAVGDMPNNGTELADSATSYLKDTLELDKFKTVYDYVYDKDQAYPEYLIEYERVLSPSPILYVHNFLNQSG